MNRVSACRNNTNRSEAVLHRVMGEVVLTVARAQGGSGMGGVGTEGQGQSLLNRRAREGSDLFLVRRKASWLIVSPGDTGGPRLDTAFLVSQGF